MSSKKKSPSPFTSEKPTGLTIEQIPKSASGPNAIKVALSHIMEETGVVKGLSALNKMNQNQGFDCPGCAWPDPDGKRSGLGEYCENGAKALAEEATNKKVDPAFFAKYSVSEMACWSDYEIGKSGRITHPMILEPGGLHYKPIEWELAFKRIAAQLNSLKTPDEAIFYTSGRTSNEAAFLYQLFVRMYGTNNLPDCSNMCHESSGKALAATLGIGKGSVTLDDFKETELVIIIGQNPGTNHPRMLTTLQETKSNGGKIITINPLPEVGLINFKHPQKFNQWIGKGTAISDLLLQVKINTDVQLLKAIIKLLSEKEKQDPGKVFDHEFIQEHTSGYDEFMAHLDQYDIDDLIDDTGVDRELIESAVEMISTSQKIIVCWAMGLTQHKNAVDNIREIVNLLLLKGSIGKPGAGTCPVRGHSNVQGDRTMGIWEAPPEAFLDKLAQNFEFSPPRNHGYDTVNAIKAMALEKAKFFFALGGNFLSATPDTAYTARALQSCDMTVHVSTKLNRSHLIHGKTSIILPCLGRSEIDQQDSGDQFVSVENSMGIVHSSQGVLKPASEDLRSEPWIVAHLAQATLNRSSSVDWTEFSSDYSKIRDAIEKTIPGFDNYNERVQKDGGFYLPNGARDRNFNTDSQKALFTINSFESYNLGSDEFLMMTIRSHDQFNTTIYGLDDRYRGIFNERRVVFMHAGDMRRHGLSDKEVVDLTSEYDGMERVARNFHVVEFSIPQGCVATYFPEANVLIPIQNVATISNTPASKSVIIKIHKRS